MKLILFTASIFVLGCSARPSASLDQFQQIQQELEQMKRSNEESIAALQRFYDKKISSLEEQLKSGKNMVSQTGRIYLPYYSFIDLK